MRLCSYVVKHDRGLAPNPFWGFCTVAVCTPNHQNIDLKEDDWIVGFSNIKRGHKLVYAMKISKKLSFDEYYRDPTFSAKKPVIKGTWQQQVGDNMYYKDNGGRWQQHPTRYHQKRELIEKDLKHPCVFISDHFYYFGSNALELCEEHRTLVRTTQGCKCKHDSGTVENFLTWLERNHNPGGVLGEPADVRK